MKLYDWQVQCIDDVRACFQEHDAVCLVVPTGGGKTVIAGEICRLMEERGDTAALFLEHRTELVEQASRTLTKFGLRHEKIIAGKHHMFPHQFAVAAVNTIVRRLDKIKKAYGVLILDEAHHVEAATWKKIIEGLPSTYGGGKRVKLLGLTATPERLDGKPLNKTFDAMVIGASISDLMEMGYLSKFKVAHAPDVFGLYKNLKKVRGDYDRGEVTRRMSGLGARRKIVIDDAVGKYLKHGNGAQFIYFGYSIQDSMEHADAFNNAGITCSHLDGEVPAKVRKDIIQSYSEGKIRGLCNVDLISEGFDVPECGCIIMGRKTSSLTLYLQQVGRCLRTAPGKEFAMIIDLCGNIGEHGMPDADRDWSLSGREKKKGEPKTDKEKGVHSRQIMCPNCKNIVPSDPKCIKCGMLLPQRYQVERITADLEEIEAWKKRSKFIPRKEMMRYVYKCGRDRGKLESLHQKLVITNGFRDNQHSRDAWVRHMLDIVGVDEQEVENTSIK